VVYFNNRNRGESGLVYP